MKEYLNRVVCCDCQNVLKTLPENSVDSICCDPPYELGFMGKSWDNTGIANNVEMWKECLRVLKPGGHLLAFSGTRTYHRMAVAIEDAGFEVRDMIEWVYGSGFSKCTVWSDGAKRSSVSLNKENDLMVENGWQGWGRGGLKPAHEPICMARKPLAEKTVAENCLRYGTGGINIDESRVGTEVITQNKYDRTPEHGNQYGNGAERKQNGIQTQTIGRFPANLIHDNSEEVRECFPNTGKSSGGRIGNKGSALNMMGTDYKKGDPGFGDSGNASRFFKSIIYTPKASKSERNKGCEDMEEVIHNDGRDESLDSGHMPQNRSNTPKKNFHPTVKPIALMEYLIKMVTPKGGIVLDPFAGSGTTGVACHNLKRNFILIEKEPEYCKIAEERLKNLQQTLI